ncbi:MAG: hypothetical protein V5A72_03440 [Candidatus Nanohaloarchaea archaeon]
MIQQLLQSEITGVSILLVLAIVVALVVAFKIMEMVFETVLVTVLSGTFYLAMKYVQGGSVALNDLLLFSFLGATLYMLYTLLSSLYSIGKTVIPLPYKVVKTVIRPFQWVWDKYGERQKRRSYVNRKTKTEDDGTDKTTKEVVLGSKEEEED